MHAQSFKECVAALRALRDAHRDQLDARIIEELDSVISAFEKLKQSPEANEKERSEACDRGLKVLGLALKALGLFSNLL